MKTAIIYARYSCDKQTEQSIEGQLRECEEFAKRNNILILDTYIDQAMTGTNDNRPAFQQMLKDSTKHEWDYVLVYRLDRFSRNKYETAIHKNTLKQNGIKVLSAKENIPDTPEGIILESVIEGMNAYYSAELSQKVKRGMRETRLKGYYQGGGLLFGYKLDGRKIVIDETNAEVVKFIYDEFSKGICAREIITRLTAMGIRRKGKPLAMNTVYNILRNEKYTGVYKHDEEIVDNMYPPIITREIFDRVKAMLETYKHGKNSIRITYLLRNKVICGYCGHAVIGESGTARNGEKKHYYKCRGKKVKLSDCNMTPIQKDILEKAVLDITVEELSKPQTMHTVIRGIMAMQESTANTNSLLNAYLKEKKQTENAIENIMLAIEKGVVAKTTAQRLKDHEARLEELERLILIEQSKCAVKLTEADIREFYEQALKLEPQMLVNYLIKQVVLFDDKIEIQFNSPIRICPDENQGFSFYTKTLRLAGKLHIITLKI